MRDKTLEAYNVPLSVIAARDELEKALSNIPLKKKLIPLAKSCFDAPEFFAAFVLWLVESGVSTHALYKSGIFHHFYVYHDESMFASEEETETNAFRQFYTYITAFSFHDERFFMLLTVLCNTFCGVRGAKVNQICEQGYLSLNIMKEEVCTAVKLTESYELPDLSEIRFPIQYGLDLYHYFGKIVLENLDLKLASHQSLLLQIKAHDGREVFEFYCDKLSSYELSPELSKKLLPYLTEYFAILPIDIYRNFIVRNPYFVMTSIYNIHLLEKLPASLIKRAVLKVLGREELYTQALFLANVISVLAVDENRFSADFVSELKSCYFSQAVAKSGHGNEIGQAFRLLSLKNLCEMKIKEIRSVYLDAIKNGKKLADLEVLEMANFTSLFNIYEAFPAIFDDHPYMNIDNSHALHCFYIESRWMLQSSKLPFDFSALLKEDYDNSNYARFHIQNMLREIFRFSVHIDLLKHILLYLQQKNSIMSLFSVTKVLYFRKDISADDIKMFFRALVSPSKQPHVPGVSFMRKPNHYSTSQIMLAVKYLLDCHQANHALNELYNAVFIENTPEKVCLNLKTYADDQFDLMLSEKLNILLAHIKRGYIEFYDIADNHGINKRSRETELLDEMPAIHRVFRKPA